ADNPFAGQVNVDGGKLQMTEGGKLGQADVKVGKAGTFAVDKPGTEVGTLDLSAGGTLSLVATPEGYSKLQVNGEDKEDENGNKIPAVNLNNAHLFTDIKNSKEEELANLQFENILATPNGSIEGNFASYDDNSELFNFIPKVVDGKAVSLTPVSAKGSLIEIATEYGLSRGLDAARALDANFGRAPTNELSRLFYTIPDKQDAATALLESLPTLAGASSQVVADTSKQLANLAENSKGCRAGGAATEDNQLWVKATNSWGNQAQHQGATGYQSESHGFGAGVEKCQGQTRLGVMVGYVYNHVHSQESVSDQTLRADTIQAGIYGNTPISAIADLDFRAGIGYSDVSTERNIKFAKRTAQGSYGNKIGYAGVGMGFNAFSTEQVEVKPFIRLDYQVVRNNHYTERGAGGLNLNVDAGTNQSLVSQVGVNVKAKIAD
ncbi:hypothetical protein QV06_11240, partial [Gallibacterium genomosp. 3]